MVNALWGRRSKVTVSTKEKLYIFHFADKANLLLVLESALWHVDKAYLVLCKWTMELAPEQLSLRKLPVWIRSWHIPLAYYHREGISYIASGVRRPLHMDRATANCTKLDYAKVCVEIEAGRPLLDKLRLEIEKDHVVEIGVEIP